MLRAESLPCCKKYVSSLFFKIWINNIHYFLLYTIFYARALLQGIWMRVSCHHARALLPGTQRNYLNHIGHFVESLSSEDVALIRIERCLGVNSPACMCILKVSLVEIIGSNYRLLDISLCSELLLHISYNMAHGKYHMITHACHGI